MRAAPNGSTLLVSVNTPVMNRSFDEVGGGKPFGAIDDLTSQAELRAISEN